MGGELSNHRKNFVQFGGVEFLESIAKADFYRNSKTGLFRSVEIYFVQFVSSYHAQLRFCA